MHRVVCLSLLATLTLGLLGCAEDQKAADRPKDVGYVAPDPPKQDAASTKAPAK